MCGIYGSVNHNVRLQKVIKYMGHRGPDEQSSYVHKNVCLHHLRLSIVDIVDGKQPMHFLDRYSIIFNGQIYNYKELKEKFNLQCETNSDTEVILHLFHQMKERCLTHFDGMFSFSIYDKLEDSIFLARDRAGKKPLYVFKALDKIVFSSELNVLAGTNRLERDDHSIMNYLNYGALFFEKTPFLNVQELLPGHFMYINTKTLKTNIQRWWNPAQYYSPQTELSYEEIKQTTIQNLNIGVKRRLLSSDLEVGSFLSGGIDSGLVTAMAAQYQEKLKTFTVSFDGAYDESKLAQLMANKYDTDHRVIKITFDNLQNDVENIIQNYGEPFPDSSAIPSYYVSKEAKQYVTVALNGDGADELFGGYRRYIPFSKFDVFSSPAMLRFAAKGLLNFTPLPRNRKSLFNYLHRFLNVLSAKDSDKYFKATIDTFTDLNHLIQPDFLDHQIESFIQDVSKYDHFSKLQKIMFLDFNLLLAGVLLVKMDIATMANSLEGRSPFLSKDILEFAPSIPDKYKIKRNETKSLLRDISKSILPEEYINQPKRGFEVPLTRWVNHDLYDLIFTHLRNPNAYCLKFIDKTFLENLLNQKLPISAERRAKVLYKLLVLEIWNNHQKRLYSSE
jgi:asparagine synthase (glutamine-hydrolysing)